MQWYEVLILICAVLLVIFPFIRVIAKKKNGTLECECGHTSCNGKCDSCMDHKDKTKKVLLTYIVEVEGMKCTMCESHINDTIRKEFQVIRVKSSRKTNTTRIVTNTLLNVQKIKATIQMAGYEVGHIRLEN